MADRYAAAWDELCSRLSAADLETGRRLAAEAPPFDRETAAFLQRILAPAAERALRETQTPAA